MAWLGIAIDSCEGSLGFPEFEASNTLPFDSVSPIFEAFRRSLQRTEIRCSIQLSYATIDAECTFAKDEGQ